MHNVIFDLGGVVLSWSPDDILKDFYADEASRAHAKREVFQHDDWLSMDRGTLLEPDAIVRFHQRPGLAARGYAPRLIPAAARK
jgi:hypothetical protein